MSKIVTNFGQIFDKVKTMRKTLYLFLFFISAFGWSQEVRLAKGAITDGIKVNDTLYETFAVYLPQNFDFKRPWPAIMVASMDGKAKQALSMFKNAAEQEGYILVGSNTVNDTLSLADNVQVVGRMLNAMIKMLPINKDRIFTAGYNDGARFASIMPAFFKEVDGVISCGAALGKTELLSAKNPFHFVGVVGDKDYSYTDLLLDEKRLNDLKMPNNLIVFDGGLEWPSPSHMGMALQFLTLKTMAKGQTAKDLEFINQTYDSLLINANILLTQDKPLLAANLLENMMEVYRPLIPIDSLKISYKYLKRSKVYKIQKRNFNNVMLKESFLRDDYSYALGEDIMTYNFNNLGWWKYQMDELDKLEKSSNIFEQHMASRLRGYINALIYDNINIIIREKAVDRDALSFLHMLKTITEPTNYDYYLKIISNSALGEDYGTALFYLEELLKNGYKDKKVLYELDYTALLRITPEYNAIIDKYLEDARYEFIKE
jgi:hypothetical protein